MQETTAIYKWGEEGTTEEKWWAGSFLKDENEENKRGKRLPQVKEVYEA